MNVIQSVNVKITRGQFIAIVGRSGSGKTTLLNLLAGLDQPSSGKVLVKGQNIADMSESHLTNMRRTVIGFIFQSFGLLPLLSAFENVELPLRITGIGLVERQNRTEQNMIHITEEGLQRRINEAVNRRT